MSPSLHESGKPHVFLLEEPEREKAYWAQLAPSGLAKRQLDELTDALYDVVQARAMSARCLDAIRVGVASRYKLVFETSGRRLVQLSHYFPEALALIDELATSPRAPIRLRVVQALWTELPPPGTTQSILRAGLRDKSREVRAFASDRIRQHDIRDLLPELIEACGRETDPATKRGMDQDLALVRDGYHLEPSDVEGVYSLVVKTPYATGAEMLDAADCTPDNIRRVIERIREQHEAIYARKRPDPSAP